MLCVAAGGLSAMLALQSFTLAWTHSIEKVRWEEDWQVTEQGLVLAEARVRGHGAGMEPAAGSRLAHGVWHYTPDLLPQARLKLVHSPYAAGYELCTAAKCQALTDLLPGLAAYALIELFPCER